MVVDRLEFTDSQISQWTGPMQQLSEIAGKAVVITTVPDPCIGSQSRSDLNLCQISSPGHQ